jgi:hypothetical protein
MDSFQYKFRPKAAPLGRELRDVNRLSQHVAGQLLDIFPIALYEWQQQTRYYNRDPAQDDE